MLRLPVAVRAQQTTFVPSAPMPAVATPLFVRNEIALPEGTAPWPTKRLPQGVRFTHGVTLTGAPRWSVGVPVGLAVAFVVALFALLLRWISSTSRSRALVSYELPSPDEIRTVSIAVDWSRRAELQSELAKLATSLPASSERTALHDGLSRAVALIAKHAGAVRYLSSTRRQVAHQDAEGAFVTTTQRFASRYRQDAFRTGEALAIDAVHARPDEGAGLVVVTVVVATLVTAPKLGPDAPVEAHLDALVPARAFQLLAFEVIWSPAVEEDRLSSAELEVLYPELVRIDTRGDVGRTQCPFCEATYPRELGECPACGAPAGASASSA